MDDLVFTFEAATLLLDLVFTLEPLWEAERERDLDVDFVRDPECDPLLLWDRDRDRAAALRFEAVFERVERVDMTDG